VSTSTYTVTEVLSENEWAPSDDPSKRTIFYDFRAKETTQVCSIGRKPDNPLKVGDSFEAEVKSEDRGKLKLKKVQQQGGWGGGGGGKDYKADPEKLRAENMRSALHAAVEFVVGMRQAGEKEATSDVVDRLARRWYGVITEALKDDGSLDDAAKRSEVSW
jgi:hypothetical protein